MQFCLHCKKPNLRINTQARYCSNICKFASYRLRSGRSGQLWSSERTNQCIECETSFHPEKFVPYKKFCSRQCGNNNRQRNWILKNPEKRKAIMQKFDKSEKRICLRKKHAKSKRLQVRRWLANNPAKSAEYSRRYIEKNPQKAKERLLRYRKSPKGITANRMRSHLQRLKIKENETESHRYKTTLLESLYEEIKGKCPLCKKPLMTIRQATIGHIYPLSLFKELAFESENLIALCEQCNKKMYNKHLIVYCRLKGYQEPIRVIEYVRKMSIKDNRYAVN
ncbi:HNH endonuclease [Candidatus Woesearchaeota archaeon]|nr:MAG: HNH endonuclease [Candidatus Woesearchaeota archaeon]